MYTYTNMNIHNVYIYNDIYTNMYTYKHGYIQCIPIQT